MKRHTRKPRKYTVLRDLAYGAVPELQRKRPLKVGVKKELVGKLKKVGMGKKEIDTFLGAHFQSPRYLLNLFKSSHRYDLQGAQSGDVLKEQKMSIAETHYARLMKKKMHFGELNNPVERELLIILRETVADLENRRLQKKRRGRANYAANRKARTKQLASATPVAA